MSKRVDLERFLVTIYEINPETTLFPEDVWADNLLALLGVDIKTTETVVIK